MILKFIYATATSTFAWYQTTSTANLASAAVGTSLTTESTTISAGEYSITLHIYSGASGTSNAFSNVQLSQNDGGDLKKGTYNSTGEAAQVVAVQDSEIASFARQVRIEVEWNVKPTEQAAINQFKNKKITGAFLLAEGNVKLLTVHNDATVGTDYSKAAIEIYVANEDALGLSINSVYAVDPSNNNPIDGNNQQEGVQRVEIVGMRINTNNPSGAEWYDATDAAAGNKYGQTADTHVPGEGSPVYHHTDALGIAEVANLTISNK